MCFPSDSGDSLFITQHPVPEAKRPRNTHRRSRMSSVVSAEVDSSPSDSDANCGVTEPRNIRNHSLPKYIFPFLLERRKRTELIYRHNKSLHVRTARTCFFIQVFSECLFDLFFLYRHSQLVASLNVSKSCGRAGRKAHHLFTQHWIWMGRTYHRYQSKFKLLRELWLVHCLRFFIFFIGMCC